MSAPGRARPRWWSWLSIALLIVGVIALVWLVWEIGPDELWRGMQRIGFGFALGCTAHFIGQVLSAVSLQACAGPGERPRFWPFLRANLAGHAINEVTPMRIGEVTKYTLLSEQMPRSRVAAALIVHNLLFMAANCVLLALAPILVVWALPFDPQLERILFVGGAIALAACIAFVVFMLRGPGELPFRLLRLVLRAETVDVMRARWQRTERLWHEVTRDRRLMWTAAWTAVASRLASVLEGVIILYFLGFAWDDALALGVVSFVSFQLVVWFAFVPFQAGVAEGAAYLVFDLLRVAPAFGVLVELARKARKMVFIGLGVLLLGWHTFRRLMARESNADNPDATEPAPSAVLSSRP